MKENVDYFTIYRCILNIKKSYAKKNTQTIMDEVWTLISLSLAMLVGCYVAGAIPLAFTLAEVNT